MVNFWLITCILATWVVVNSAKHHQNAPSQPPDLSPAPAVDCTSLIYDMVDCMSYLSNGDNETMPEESCCSGFKTVVDTDAECICEGLKESASLGIDVNMTKAMALPSACGVSSPPLSSCNIAAPAPAPNEPPANPPLVSAPKPVSQNPPPPMLPPTPTTGSQIPASPAGGPASEAPAASPANYSGAYTISTSFALFGVILASFLFILSILA